MWEKFWGKKILVCLFRLKASLFQPSFGAWPYLATLEPGVFTCLSIFNMILFLWKLKVELAIETSRAFFLEQKKVPLFFFTKFLGTGEFSSNLLFSLCPPVPGTWGKTANLKKKVPLIWTSSCFQMGPAWKSKNEDEFLRNLNACI